INQRYHLWPEKYYVETTVSVEGDIAILGLEQVTRYDPARFDFFNSSGVGRCRSLLNTFIIYRPPSLVGFSSTALQEMVRYHRSTSTAPARITAYSIMAITAVMEAMR
ncbi:MAG: hypothetical protein ACYC64_08925, partial [Armatimonadota bacterium]